MTTDKIIKMLVDTGEELHRHEGLTIIGGVILLPKDAPIQAITSFSYGRVSMGDWCSMIVTSIKMARQACEKRGISPVIYESIIAKAIQEGLEKG